MEGLQVWTPPEADGSPGALTLRRKRYEKCSRRRGCYDETRLATACGQRAAERDSGLAERSSDGHVRLLLRAKLRRGALR
jgi:hypothetical protein